ncbi:MAG: hypothetical protein HYX35_05915 [Proteobacteria bacterium]|nr:hypothetical protein [Pseudomonadota bacterium]
MNLKSYLFRMSFSLILLSGIGVFFASSLWAIFLSNPKLNTLIIALTLGGGVYAFYQLFRLKKDSEALLDLKKGQWTFSSQDRTSFLEPILSFVAQKKSFQDPSLAKRLAESLADRLDNERVFPRYLIGLLVFLGLLGTFWGLSQTITSIASLIQNMPSDAGNSGDFFTLLKQNLQSPLAGMGTAFSSSLFGLGGSLLIGFLELQVGHAYARFLNEADFYLTTSSHSAEATPTAAPLIYLQALLTRNVEGIDQLMQLMETSEKNERQTAVLLEKLVVSLSFLLDHNKTQQTLMTKFLESPGLDEESRKSLHNIELALSHTLQHQREGRDEFLRKLRDEMHLVARTIASASDQQRLVS